MISQFQAAASEALSGHETSPRIATETAAEGRIERSSRLINQAFLDVDDDLRDIAMYPFDHPDKTLLFLGGIGALVLVDKPVTRYYQDKIEPIFKGYSLKAPKLAKDLGFNGADGYLALGLAGSYALGIVFNDERSQKAALLAAKASVYSVVFSHLILKPLFGRSRPVPNLSSATGDSPPYTTNPYSFGHFHRPHLGAYQPGTAMPSFHFTEYFAVARVYSRVYDNYLVPYAVAAALLTSNIKGHKHWVSDMVAGALIGTMIGSEVVDNAEGVAEDDAGDAAYLVIPSVSSDQVALSVYHTF